MQCKTKLILHPLSWLAIRRLISVNAEFLSPAWPVSIFVGGTRPTAQHF
ncbi:unnamed protein product [Nezara viridula]|uniref:Uncharacterized protein n=1 Tax=Nezara viridula TaxID=85310 RepID=A0A9P0MVX5_NEZVI|nr:unnamed protein product [Nezara viridula]